jgi:hypothetical protein
VWVGDENTRKPWIWSCTRAFKEADEHSLEPWALDSPGANFPLRIHQACCSSTEYIYTFIAQLIYLPARSLSNQFLFLPSSLFTISLTHRDVVRKLKAKLSLLKSIIMPYKLHHWDYGSDTSDPGWPRRYLTYDHHTACSACHEPSGLLRVLQHLFGGPATRCRHPRGRSDGGWGGDVRGFVRRKGCVSLLYFPLFCYL